MTTDVVIGAGSGMGAAVARRFARDGRRLLLADLDLPALEGVAGELSTDVEVHRCDITDADALAGLAAAAGELGRLVLTAGLSPTMGEGPRILEVDLIGPARMLRAFEPHARTGSVAVLLASMAGHLVPAAEEVDRILDDPLADTIVEDLAGAGVDLADPGLAYGLAKRALIRLVRRSAMPWGARGARIVSLSPGIVDTPMGRQEQASQPVMADLVSASPLGRMIDADEVAAVVELLASDAAVAITGTDVLVDGGAVAGLLA
jgi:NAD(P)-dependent dehydrogenase (short-subunit alcohol dehydrogenase family)